MRKANVATQASLEISRSALLSSRAWVGVITPIQVIEPLTFTSEGAFLTIKYGIKNGGTAPARNISFSSTFKINVDAAQMANEVFRKECNPELVKARTEAAGIPLLFPGDLFDGIQPENFGVGGNECKI